MATSRAPIRTRARVSREDAGPVRRCVGCGRRAPAASLVRFVRGVRDAPAPTPDPLRREPGRGVHLCPRRGCVERALKRGALQRALRGTASRDVPASSQLLGAAVAAYDEALVRVQSGARRAGLLDDDGRILPGAGGRFAARLEALRAIRARLEVEANRETLQARGSKPHGVQETQ